jgi:hypothetical protein
MEAVDFKQIPNLGQVFTVALVPLLFVAIVLLGLIGVLWGKIRLLQSRIASLQADLKTVYERSARS